MGATRDQTAETDQTPGIIDDVFQLAHRFQIAHDDEQSRRLRTMTERKDRNQHAVRIPAISKIEGNVADLGAGCISRLDHALKWVIFTDQKTEWLAFGQPACGRTKAPLCFRHGEEHGTTGVE